MEISDSERIDWLEKHKVSVLTVTEQKKEFRTDSSIEFHIVTKFVGWGTTDSYLEFDSIREAIDDAIKKRAQK